jgi:hypothetical protein
MDREEILAIIANPRRRSLADYLEAREAVDRLSESDEISTLYAQYKRALADGNATAARDARDKADLLTAQNRELAKELDHLIANAEVREAEFEKETEGAQKLQRRGLEVGAAIHEVTEQLCGLLSEHRDIAEQLQRHNERARLYGRVDLDVTLPIELLCAHLGVSAGLLPDPEEWQMPGYWPTRPRAHDNVRRFDLFCEILEPKKKRAA